MALPPPLQANGFKRSLESSGCAPVVRPIRSDALELKQLLDIGVMNLLVPKVRPAREAARRVESCSYPPRGIRRMASGGVRASRFGRFTDYVQRIDQELCVVVPVKTQEGLARPFAATARSDAPT